MVISNNSTENQEKTGSELICREKQERQATGEICFKCDRYLHNELKSGIFVTFSGSCLILPYSKSIYKEMKTRAK